MISISKTFLFRGFFACLAALFIFSANTFASELEGKWLGQINLRGLDIRLFLDVKKDAKGNFDGHFSSPEQGIRDLDISSINLYSDGKITIALPDCSANFIGKLTEQKTLKGDVSQGGTDFPTEFSK